MKAGIHPDYHVIKVVTTDGSTFETRSTYGKEGDILQLDVDPKTHPAWTGGGGYVNENASQIAKFSKRFSGLKFGGSKEATATPKEASAKKESPKAAAPKAENADKKKKENKNDNA